MAQILTVLAESQLKFRYNILCFRFDCDWLSLNNFKKRSRTIFSNISNYDSPLVLRFIASANIALESGSLVEISGWGAKKDLLYPLARKSGLS